MLASSPHPRRLSRDGDSTERRLRRLEQELEKLGARGIAGATQAADRVEDLVASALSSLADRFRGGAMRDEAAKMASEAARYGNVALHRLSREVEHRPLLTLAVAVGVGILIGMAGRRR
jgi:hypothetical protein